MGKGITGDLKGLGRERPYKRPFDLAVLVLAHLFPLVLPVWGFLWILVPLAIWLEDRGPIFYIQKRVGRGGRIFCLFKFRSMRMRSDCALWPEFTSKDDPRITRVGKILRRTALDELPQVINLWKGDISFVGPRALPVRMHEEYTKENPDFVRRLQVRPGLTGPAQIYLPRHCNAEKRLKYDLLYIREASARLDLKLIMISIWLTLTGRWGAGPREPEAELHGEVRS